MEKKEQIVDNLVELGLCKRISDTVLLSSADIDLYMRQRNPKLKSVSASELWAKLKSLGIRAVLV